MGRLQPNAILLCLVLVAVACTSDDTATTSSSADSVAATVGTATSVEPTANQAPSTTVTTASASAMGDDDGPLAPPAVYETSEELCSVFTGREVLEIVRQAYAAERADYPTPDVIEPVPDGTGYGWISTGYEVICEWIVPGTPAGWGRADFTVSLSDHSDVRLFMEEDGETATGATHIEDYHTGGTQFSDMAEGYGVADLVPPGMVFLGGWSPGFDVYVESVDRILNFRHDLAAGAEWPPGVFEDYGVELRILTLMLERMRWLPAE